MDLAAIYGGYRADGHGRAAFEPGMMVALLIYAYAVGERSSRAIERRCHVDVAFRVITANQVPDHATIARFRARHEQALQRAQDALAALARNGEPVTVARLARERVTVVLTGEGADETLAGYTRYAFTLKNAAMDRAYRSLVPSFLRRGLRQAY